ncbi:MAG: SNF2-related protein [Candidatus Helarchaeota archaeon]
MFIKLEENKILIKDYKNNLHPYHIAQIKMWDFKRDIKNHYLIKENGDIKNILQKLFRYLDEEKIEYSFSSECKDYLEKIYKNIKEFEIRKEKARDFKNGKIDANEFEKFITYINKNIKRDLKKHQQKAAYHLNITKNGANFSVPGSGKTAVVLTIYEKLRLEGKINLLFVVGPPSCFGPWKNEFKLTLGRLPKFNILAGGEKEQRKSEYYISEDKKAELYLTTFQTLINDQNEVIKLFSTKGIKPFLIIDEAHYIKQIAGRWSSAVLRIAEYVDFRCLLTGTPIPKSYSDLFNLFDFLWPENNPIDNSTKLLIQMEEEKKSGSIKKILDEKVGPLFYRVRKSDLGLKKPSFHPPINLEMNHYERLIYDAIENKIRDYSKDDYLKNIELIIRLKRGRITRLRQATSYVKLISSAIPNYDEYIIEDSDLADLIIDYDKIEKPAKLGKLLELVKNLRQKKKKVVIWAYFIGTLKLIYNSLRNNGFNCKLIYGETPTEKASLKEEESRESIRNEFVDPNSNLHILIANPAACAESISLHKTCYNAIYYDLSYNCAQYLQSLDRIHRVGGSEEKIANYYFLQYKDTIEQDIKKNLDIKAKKMYEIIEKDYSIYSIDMLEETNDDIQAYNRLFK